MMDNIVTVFLILKLSLSTRRRGDRRSQQQLLLLGLNLTAVLGGDEEYWPRWHFVGGVHLNGFF